MNATHTISAFLLAASVALGAFFIATPEGVAQQPGDAALETPGDDPRRAELREKIATRISEARAKMLREVVGLDEDTVQRLEPIITELDQKRRGLHRRIKKRRRELRGLVEAGATDAEIEPVLEALIQDQATLDGLKLELHERTRGFLSATERAKLMAALPAFERKIRTFIRKARRKARKARKRGGKSKAKRKGKRKGKGKHRGRKRGQGPR